MVSPIVIGPGPATIMVMLLATHRALVRPPILAALAAIAIISPWLFELAGVFGARITVVGRDIVMHTMAEHLDPRATMISLIVYLLALVMLAALLARMQDDDRRTARRSLQMQAWQLRQLVPRANTLPPI
jgi:hypothetical protein